MVKGNRAWGYGSICTPLVLAAWLLACGSDSKPAPVGMEPAGVGGSGTVTGEGEVCGNSADDDGDGEGDCSDPDCLAVVANPTAPVPFAATVQWLYTPREGSDCAPLQEGVAAGALVPGRLAVVRGSVADSEGQPLGGARIRIVGAPELGSTRSRADGIFDIAVNGGAKVTVEISGPDWLAVHRRAAVEPNSFAWVEPAVLLPRSELVTAISLNGSGPLQVARSQAVEDASGRRAPVVFFPSGTQALALGADGNEVPLDRLGVRLTEFTVGERGPQAMPADLPASSAYTYAFELGVDEADAMGARSVSFDRALPVYLENFLGFPAGTPVPVGYYDLEATEWQPEPDGVVIAIVAEAGGIAQIDLDGDGAAEGTAALEAAGFGADEPARLAELYDAGQSLWRVQVDHFSRFDLNWGFGFPGDAEPPPWLAALAGLFDLPGCADGSVLRIDNRTLGETVALPGTGYSLFYQSDRAAGGQRRTLDVEVAGATVPASLKHIDVSLFIAGQRHEERLAPEALSRFRYAWNGRDAFGRPLQGSQTFELKIGYAYDGDYTSNENSNGASFAEPGSIRLTGSKTREEVVIERTTKGKLGGWDARAYGLGGFSLDVHHAYDTAGRTLYFGDGRQRSAETIPPLVTDVFAGTDLVGREPFVRSDGTLLFVSEGVIYSFAGGQAVPFAGGGSPADGRGDGGPATEALLGGARDLTEGPDGSIYFLSDGVRRVDPTGRIETLVGGGSQFILREGQLATESDPITPGGLAVSADGIIYFSERADSEVWRVNREQRFEHVAGGNADGEARPANTADVFDPAGLTFGPGGELFLAVEGRDVVRRIDVDGLIHTVAGISGEPGRDGDGGPATAARVNDPRDLAFDRQGNLIIAQVDGNLRIVGIDGNIDTLVDVGTSGDITVAPDGSIYAGLSGDSIVKVAPSLPGASFGDVIIAAEDGSEVYRFDSNGRHLATVDAVSGVEVRRFEYDAEGRLERVIEDDQRITSIERAADGSPSAIVGPYGVRTELAVDTDGYLAQVTDAAGQAVALEYAAGGLLTSMTDARGGRHEYAYDDAGRLVSDTDPSGAAQVLEPSQDGSVATITHTTPLGRATRHERATSPAGEEQRVITPGGALSSRLRDPAGNITVSSADGSIATTRFEADPRFGAMAPIHAEMRITLPSGLESVVYQSQVTELTNPADPLSLSRQQRETDINDRIFTSEYDAATRTLIERSPVGRELTTLFDDRGRVIETRVPGLLPSFYAYDADGRLVSVTSGSGADTRRVELDYDASGWLSTSTDALGQSTTLVPDAIGRTVRNEYADGTSTAFAYDATSNLIGLTPPGQAPHQLEYDARDLLSTYLPPELASGATPTTYAYDADKALTAITLPGLDPITYGYTPAGLLNGVQHAAGTITLGYDAAERLITTASPDGVSLAYSYDGSLPLATTWSGAIAGTVSRTYDDDFFVTAISVNDTAIAYTRDDDGLIVRAGALTLTHDPTNALLTATGIGDLDATFTHTARGELASHSVTGQDGALFATTHTYDALGRIATSSETIAGVNTLTAYSYDSVGQLTQATTNGTVSAAYTYDPDGNRLSIQTGATSAQASFDAQERLLTQGATEYGYTERGTLQTKTDASGTTSYTYDPLGNLSAVTLPDGRALTYLTDAQNRRVAKLVGGTLQRGWLYQDNLKPIAELDPAGAVLSRFVYATKSNAPDLMIQGATTYAFITDIRGSVRLVVNTTTSEVVQQIDYGPFGEITADSNPGFQPFGFAGGLYDVDTGLTRFGARDYDAQSGRWTNKDPLGFGGGQANLYAYVGNDPINAVDPDGEAALLVPVLVSGITSGLIDAGIQYAVNGCIDWGQAGMSALAGAAFGAALGAAPRALVALRGGAIAGKTLNGTVGNAAAGIVREVLKGRQPLTALTSGQRRAAAAFYRDVATRMGGREAAAASKYNVARAEFLEGTRSSLSRTLPEFIKNGFK